MIVFVAVAGAGLLGWLALTVARTTLAIRPRAPEQPAEPDVELVVRERLYGPGARAPRP